MNALIRKTSQRPNVLIVKILNTIRITQIILAIVPFVLPLNTISKRSSTLQILVSMDTKAGVLNFLQLNTDKSLASTLQILEIGVNKGIDVKVADSNKSKLTTPRIIGLRT